ncbi:MAG: DUF4124 domain-containing protein [Methylococcales bacterium]
MKKVFFVLMALSSAVAQADVYKCKSEVGAIEYQSTPCSGAAVKQAKIVIKPQDPRVSAEAQQRFSEWKVEQERLEAIKAKEDKEHQAELQRQLTVEALIRSTLAQERQAAASQQPVIINNFMPPRRYNFGFHHDSQLQPQFPARDQDRHAKPTERKEQGFGSTYTMDKQ